jgi:hypothetical protein
MQQGITLNASPWAGARSILDSFSTFCNAGIKADKPGCESKCEFGKRLPPQRNPTLTSWDALEKNNGASFGITRIKFSKVSRRSKKSLRSSAFLSE